MVPPDAPHACGLREERPGRALSEPVLPRADARAPRLAPAVAVGALVLVTLLLIGITATLYGDGSVMLVQAIQAGGGFVSRSRWLLNDIRDSPVVALVNVGVTNLRALAVAQSVGYLGTAALAWTLAVVLSAVAARRFVVVTVVAGFCVGTMASFGACELLLALGLVTLLAVLLSDPRPWSGWAAGGAIACALVLVVSHESIALCAVVWGVHAAVRAVRSGSTRERVAGGVLVLAAVACIAWSWLSIAALPDGGAHGFLDQLTGLWPVSAVLLLLGAVAVVTVSLVPVAASRPVLRVPLLAAGVVFSIVGVVLATRLGPGAGYNGRAWCVLAAVLAQLTLAVLWWRARTADPTTAAWGSSAMPWAAVAFLLVALVIPVANGVLWAAGVTEIRDVLAQQNGLVRPEEVLSETGQRALFDWTNPALSVVLRSSADGAVLLDPATAAGRPDPTLLFPTSQAQQQLPPAYTWR